MAVRGIFKFAMAGRGTGGFNVTFQNAERVKRIINEVEDGLRQEANKEMRDAAQRIAKSLIPDMKSMAAMSPVAIAPALADTARAKRDRLVMVQVGGVNPKLSGFKPYKRASGRNINKGSREDTSRNIRGTLAWGSELGPYPGSEINRYGVPRRESGYWVQPAIQSNLDRAKAEYEEALDEIIRTKSRYR